MKEVVVVVVGLERDVVLVEMRETDKINRDKENEVTG
jgi:hypothetical protein